MILHLSINEDTVDGQIACEALRNLPPRKKAEYIASCIAACQKKSNVRRKRQENVVEPTVKTIISTRQTVPTYSQSEIKEPTNTVAPQTKESMRETPPPKEIEDEEEPNPMIAFADMFG